MLREKIWHWSAQDRDPVYYLKSYNSVYTNIFLINEYFDLLQWIIFFVWVVAGVTALPILIVSELVIPKDPWHEYEERYVCQEMWDDMDQQKQYTYVILVLQYILPVAVLVFTYGRIVGEIWGKKTPGEAHQHRDLRLARSKRKVRIN